jgi:uncharacterized protein YhfF
MACDGHSRNPSGPIADSARPAIAPDLAYATRRPASSAQRVAGQWPQHRAGDGGEGYVCVMDSGRLPALELAFPGPERDSGVAAILAGRKTALTGLLQILEHAAEPVPKSGQRFSVLDSAGQPAAVIELTEVRVVPISEVDDEYARAEGRGYADAAEWRRAHEDFFCSEAIAEFLGAAPVIDDGTLVVTERFRLVTAGDGADH